MSASSKRPRLLPLLLAAAAAGCSLHPDEPRPPATWGYGDGPATIGPSAWSTMPGAEACGVGTMQSPIALETARASHAPAPALRVDYQPTSSVEVADTGHTMRITYPAGSTLGLGDETYDLAEIHFHARSEHTIDGISYPLEIHLVHLDRYRHPAVVVAVLVREGAPSPAFQRLLDRLPPDGATAAPTMMAPFATAGGAAPSPTIDADELLPRDHSYLAYQGSLSTPPCSEQVVWLVMTQPIEASAEQLAAYAARPGFAESNRPTQPINNRTVVLHAESDDHGDAVGYDDGRTP